MYKIGANFQFIVMHCHNYMQQFCFVFNFFMLNFIVVIFFPGIPCFILTYIFKQLFLKKAQYNRDNVFSLLKCKINCYYLFRTRIYDNAGQLHYTKTIEISNLFSPMFYIFKH